MTEENMTVDEVMQVRDRTLEENYSPHDILKEYFVARVEEWGYRVEEIGTEKEDLDSEYISYGDSPDLAVVEDGDVVAFVEIKSKRESSADWFGRLNRSTFEECVWGESKYTNGETDFEGSVNVDEPVFCYMGVVDEERGLVVRDGFVELHSEEQVVEGFRSHGNLVVGLDRDEFRNFNWFFHALEDAPEPKEL